MEATVRAMQRVSPVDLTLADVAKEAGVVPATLIQRFGTKRELLLANCKVWTAGVAERFADARKRHGSPLRTIVEYFVEQSAFAATPETMAHFLAYVQIDLTDPAFHAELLSQSRKTRAEIEKLLKEAAALGELKDCDTAALSSLIQQLNSGAMIEWAVGRSGKVGAAIRTSLLELLRPYLRNFRHGNPAAWKKKK